MRMMLKMVGRTMVRCQLLILGVVAVSVLCAPAANAEIRIAVAGPMTGAYAWFGEQYQRAAELAVEDLDARGGVLGQQVELIVGDDFCDQERRWRWPANWPVMTPSSSSGIIARTPRSQPRRSTSRQGSFRFPRARLARS